MQHIKARHTTHESTKGMEPSTPHCRCYVLASHDFKRTYAGMTNNLTRRMRQHDGALKGGAKATRGFAPCQLLFVVTGFGPDKRSALRTEWRLKAHRQWTVPGAQSALHKRQLLLHKMLGWAEDALDGRLRVVHGLPSSCAAGHTS